MKSDNEVNAAKCQALAQRAVDPAARQRWMSMAEFWLQQGKEDSEPSEEEADLVKL
jgi:Holliday junction resolvase-like predicted endonuclease